MKIEVFTDADTVAREAAAIIAAEAGRRWLRAAALSWRLAAATPRG